MTDFGMFILSYLIGSIPFSYLVPQYFAKQDITRTGSKNIGARNAWQVTGKPWIGVLSLILDMSKGVLVVAIAYLINHSYEYSLFNGSMAILGHNYSIFINFKGGRGLATTAGVMAVIAPVAIFVWLAIYYISNIYSKDIYVRSLIAIAGTFISIIINTEIFALPVYFGYMYYNGYYDKLIIYLGILLASKQIPEIIKQKIKNNTEN